MGSRGDLNAAEMTRILHCQESNLGRSACCPSLCLLNLLTPWPESVSELYGPSDCRLSAKLMPSFTGRGCCVSARRIPMAVFSVSRPKPIELSRFIIIPFLSLSLSISLLLKHLAFVLMLKMNEIFYCSLFPVVLIILPDVLPFLIQCFEFRF
jgi:hypothetical protein